MMVSYSATDYLYTWISYYNTTYFDWAIHDAITIVSLIIAYGIVRLSSASLLYLITGLSINMLLMLSMHLDVYIYGNQEPWILWDIYLYSVNVIDLTMVVALIVDRDFLGLHKLKSKVLNYLKSKDSHVVT